MRNLFNKAKNNCAAIVSRAKAAVCRTRAVLASGRAESFVDSAVKILIAVVIGALLLAGLYLLFGDTILPELTRRIQDMFNYQG
jgi:hypothetical protein